MKYEFGKGVKMKKLVLFFGIIFIVFLALVLIPELVNSKNKNDEKFVLYNTNIKAIYFDSIKLDLKGSTETVRLTKTEYDNSIYDIGFEVLTENIPADFKYDGILKLMIFDEKNNLIDFKEITAWEQIVFSGKDHSKIKIAVFCRDVFKISGEYIDLVLSVEKEDKQLSDYPIKCFLGPAVTP